MKNITLLKGSLRKASAASLPDVSEAHSKVYSSPFLDLGPQPMTATLLPAEFVS